MVNLIDFPLVKGRPLSTGSALHLNLSIWVQIPLTFFDHSPAPVSVVLGLRHDTRLWLRNLTCQLGFLPSDA